MTKHQPKPRAFIAYAGNLFPEHASADFARIRRRYTDVIFPFTQDNAHYDVEAFRTLMTLARSFGLVPWISPWGGRHFGGEGLDAGMQVGSWVNAALRTEPSGIHFDEPTVPMPVLRTLVTAAGSLQTMISLQPERVFGTVPLLPSLTLIATEAYCPDPNVGLIAAQRARMLTPTPLVVWAQAFRVPRGEEHTSGEVLVKVVRDGHIPGVWPYMGGRGRGVLLSDDPDAVQDTCDRALTRAFRR